MRESIPDREGFECHYHDIDIPGLPPDHLEREFQKIEGPACALFRVLSNQPGRPLLNEREKDAALLFFAVQAARVPQSKDKYKRLILNGAQTFMEALAYSPEFFERSVATAHRLGMVTDFVEQSHLREAVEGQHIVPNADMTSLSVGLWRLAYAILDKLDGKHYTLWYSDGPEWFVCSDYPVGLFYSLSVGDVLEDPTTMEKPTVEIRHKTMYMPLAYNVALVIHSIPDVPVVQKVQEWSQR